MAYIYKIINSINNKVYVGKTEYSIEKRFKEHCADAFRFRNEKRPLYSAMRKYGIEKFYIELIEETDDPNEREIYWIEFFEGYKKGYNATRGGDGKCFYDHEAIRQELLINPKPKEVAKKFNCCVDIVRDIAKQSKIKVLNQGNSSFLERQKLIGQYDKQTGQLLKTFESTVAAGQWCFESGKCATLNSGIRSHISEVANGKRKSAYGYVWKYI